MRDKIPENVHKYAESPVFSNSNVPKKLTQIHSTKAGVWGKLNVLRGSLDYTISGPPKVKIRIKAGEHAVIPPEEAHYVTLETDTEFQIDFLK